MEVTRLFLVLVVLAGSTPHSLGRQLQVIGRSTDGVEKPLRYLIVPAPDVQPAGPSLVSNR